MRVTVRILRSLTIKRFTEFHLRPELLGFA
jgi:hypothetical protein